MFKTSLGLVTLAATAALAFAAPALAQKPAPVHADSGLPFCSASVKDRCIQKVDLRREGKPTTAKAG